MLRIGCVVLLAIMLSSCGGGGGGSSQNLDVYFNFRSASLYEFESVTLSPELTGIDGNATNCSVSQGALPNGLSLDNNCNIVGETTATGTFNATITLTTPNYSGSLTSPITIQVASDLAEANPSLATLTTGSAISATPLVRIVYNNSSGSILPTEDAAVTADMLFQLAPGSNSLPVGLSMDPGTGNLTGLPVYGGTTSISIIVTLSHNGVSVTLPAVPVTITIDDAPTQFSYGPDCQTSGQTFCEIVSGAPVNLRPTISTIAAGVISYSYSANLSMIPGLSINSTTGVISGSTSVPTDTGASVVLTTVFTDGSSVQSTDNLNINIDGIQAVFDDLAYQIGTAQQYPQTVTPGGYYSLINGTYATIPCNGCTFGLSMAPGSTASGITSTSTVPSWATVNSTTGVITFTPPSGTVTGQYNFYLVITGALNGTQVVSMSLFSVMLYS